jgi:hypothetical protein
VFWYVGTKKSYSFQNYFFIGSESQLEVGYSKLAEAQHALSISATWSLRGILEAFLEDFWAESCMVGNFIMSYTQWNHQAPQMPSPTL